MCDLYRKLFSQFTRLLVLIILAILVAIIILDNASATTKPVGRAMNPLLLFDGTDSGLYIDAKNMVLNQQEQTVTFNGEAILYFADIVIKTEKIAITYDNSKSSGTRIKLINLPNKLIALKKKNQELLVANSALIDVLNHKVFLRGNVRIDKGGHILVIKEITYTTRLRSVTKR